MSEETSMAFSLYGTPAESLTHRFCSLDRKNMEKLKI